MKCTLNKPAYFMGLFLLASLALSPDQAYADELPNTSDTVGRISALDNTNIVTYIEDCKYATCVGDKAADWSERHPYGVAISVQRGTQPAVTDDQMIQVLTRDFQKNGIADVRFYFEQGRGQHQTLHFMCVVGSKGLLI